MTCAYYVAMGGMVLPGKTENSAFSAAQPSVNTRAFRELMRTSRSSAPPNLSQETVSDRSKADALAKPILCIQALWFCAQCITRLVERLGITLLELNAFAHCICAIVIYFIWWHKPYDVKSPMVIVGNVALATRAKWELQPRFCHEHDPTDRRCSAIIAPGMED